MNLEANEPLKAPEPRKNLYRRICHIELMLLVLIVAVVVGLMNQMGINRELTRRGVWMKESDASTELLLEQELARLTDDRWRGKQDDARFKATMQWLKENNPSLNVPTLKQIKELEPKP